MAIKIVNGVEIETTEEEDAEREKMAIEFESKKAERDAVRYKTLRKSEYPAIEEVVVAMVEKYEENRPEAMVEIMAKRMAIKEKYPKPS